MKNQTLYKVLIFAVMLWPVAARVAMLLLSLAGQEFSESVGLSISSAVTAMFTSIVGFLLIRDIA